MSFLAAGGDGQLQATKPFALPDCLTLHKAHDSLPCRGLAGVCVAPCRCLCDVGVRSDGMQGTLLVPYLLPLPCHAMSCLRVMVNYHCSLLCHDQVTELHSVRGCSLDSSLGVPCSLLDAKGKEGHFWDSVLPVPPQRCPSPFSCM